MRTPEYPDLADLVMIPCELTVPETSRYSYLHSGKGRMLDPVVADFELS